MLDLYNNCSNQKEFPNNWKVAKLKIILKDQKRDRRHINSYRPIALLSVVGKIYEKVIVERIQQLYEEQDLASTKQFVFRKGKRVDDAFLNIRRTIKYCDKKYAVAPFVDIEGAFDNIWWPAMLKRIADANCSTQILNIIKKYFKHRNVIIENTTKSYTRRMEKGCPQGSILGPAAWVWCMDVLLHELETSIPEEMVEITAYADDLACVIKANTRKEITNHGTKLIELINKWCRSHHLRMSTSKTVAMLVKGSMNEKHLPTLKINGKNVKYVNTVKYLGVILDRRLTFVAHATISQNKGSGVHVFCQKSCCRKMGHKNGHSKSTIQGCGALYH